MKSHYMMDVFDVSSELGVSKGKAYKVIKELNKELEEKGFIVVSGKVPTAFWKTKFYSRENVEESRKEVKSACI